MKQRTYLIIFVKQTTYLITLPDRSRVREILRNASQYLIHQDLLHYSPLKPGETGYMRCETVLLRFSPRKRRQNH